MKSNVPCALCITLILLTAGFGCSNKEADARAQKEEADRKESIKLLQEIRTSVSINNRPGEAFLVLNSDAVIYMADMQILGFRDDFKQNFDAWKKAWIEERDSSIGRIITPGTPLANKIKEIDVKIADLNTNEASMQGNSEEAVKQLRAQIATDLAATKGQLDEISQAVSEYEKITKEQDANIQRVQDSFDEVQRQIDTLVSDTIRQINEYIISSKIQVSKIPESLGEKLFVETNRELSVAEPASSKRSGFYLCKKRFNDYKFPSLVASGYYEWFYSENIPAQLENSGIATNVTNAYNQWVDLNNQRDGCSKNISKAKDEERLALLPWMNQYDLIINKYSGLDIKKYSIDWNSTSSSDHGLHLTLLTSYGSLLTAKSNVLTNDISAKEQTLRDIDARGPKFQELLAQEIKKRHAESQLQKDELAKQKENLITEATGNALDALRDKYKLKFFEMLLTKKTVAVTTGSRGDFDIPADISYVFAERSRQNKEHLVWLIKVDKAQPRIRMSNSNLVDSGASIGDYWMMTAILP